jgi:hypothetical protein
MRHMLKIALASAVALIGAAASAQPPPGIPQDVYDALVPEGAILSEAYECPDPAERQTKPECCRITMDIDVQGTATRADVKCTFAPLEPVTQQCQLTRKHEPRIAPDGPKTYSRTDFQEHYPAIRSGAEFMAMRPIAEKACDSLR